MTTSPPIALVTGATRGIGAAIATQLGQNGMTVVGTATTDTGAEKISAALAAQNIQGCGMCLDVTNTAAIDDLLARITQDFGAPTVLINNAGIARDNLMLRMKAEEWDQVIQTNLSAIFNVTKACLKPMIKARWGRIISISSVVGLTGNAGQANYAAAKAGLIGFSKSLAQEIAARNITVNVITPGFIETDMTSGISEENRTFLMNKIPMARLGQPEDIAHAAAFLASDGASYITGETLNVNGGMFMP